MGGHARFSPSSGKRRLECPPSLLLEEQFPDEESPFAAEGSAGHAMAEYLINKYLKKRTKRPVSDYYSDELLEAVDVYVEYDISQIEQARHECPDPFIGVELKVSLADRIPDCFGTADMVVVDSHKIHIIDLKLGKGVMVDAERNVQLMIYGLGVLDMIGFLYEIDTVELTIVQPRRRAVRTGRGLPLRALLHLRAVRPAALYAVHRGVLDVRVRRARLTLPARRGRDAHGVRGRENDPRRAGADRHFDGAAVSAVYERPCQGRERQGEHFGESGAGGRVVRGHPRLRRAGELDGIFRAGVHPRLRVCIEVNEDGKE